ncbi:MAG: nucleoside recognition domain-containing protein [Chthoniobacterales bacterium]
MLNYLWLGLILLSVILAGVQGQLPAVTLKAFESSKDAVMLIALPLVGTMALWLGIMRLAEKSGFIYILARGLRPLMRWLFPDVPSNHPAVGSMVMNMAANMLGLGNAATPLGLKAMQELEKLNPRPGTATNAMCTFLAINTSSIQLIPATAVSILAVAGSINPTAIIGTSLITSLCSTAAAIIAVKFLEKLPAYRLPPLTASQTAVELSHEENVSSDVDTTKSLSRGSVLILLLFILFFIFAGVKAFTAITEWKAIHDLPSRDAAKLFLITAVQAISVIAIPFFLAFFPLYAALKRVPVYEEFVEGAKDGFQVAIRIIPYLIAIFIAIGMFRAAGGVANLSQWLGPILTALHFPVDLLPLSLIRPLSGSGATGIFAEIVKAHGPDSLISRMAGTIMGGTETTFYVIAVYFGSAAVKRTRHAVPAGLCADMVGIIIAVVVCNIFFA